jgi:hypothetical protein
MRRPFLPCNFFIQRSDASHPDGIIQSPLPPLSRNGPVVVLVVVLIAVTLSVTLDTAG